MHNSIKYVLLTVLAALFANTASAQFTIQPKKDSIKIDALHLINDLPPTMIEARYFDRAKWEAEKRKLRKERNTIEFNASLETSLQQFENWTGSGSNNFYILTTLFFRHQYKKDKLSVDYRADANYGMNFIDDKLFKNKDEFKINAQMGWTARENWSYSASTNFRSQFTTGYKSRTDSTVVSRFMAPGYFDLAVGFTYSKKDFPLKFTLSPVGGNIVTVLDEEINAVDKYGVKAGERLTGKIGPSVDTYFDLSFGKKKKPFRYRSNLYVFAGYRTIWDPTVRWENTLDIRISRHISTKLYSQLYYLKEASTALQYQYSFMIGLKYVFKNK